MMNPEIAPALQHLAETMRPYRELAETVIRNAPDKDAPEPMKARLMLAELRATFAEAHVAALMTSSAIDTVRNAANVGRVAMDPLHALRAGLASTRNIDPRI